MKYIRTKDGIMKIDFEIETELPIMIGIHTEECEIGEYRGIEVLKQADTIEELCDEYVIYAEDYGYFNPAIIHRHWVFDTIEEVKEQIELIETGIERIIYGAIWTGKGLIYVAKMNKKGELELL